MKMTLDEYLGTRNLSSPISSYMLDKTVFPHGLTLRQRKKLDKACQKNADEYSIKRNEAIQDYNRLVSDGTIVPKTVIEQLIDAAKGHPDNQSTQAAIRLLHKRNITL